MNEPPKPLMVGSIRVLAGGVFLPWNLCPDSFKHTPNGFLSCWNEYARDFAKAQNPFRQIAVRTVEQADWHFTQDGIGPHVHNQLLVFLDVAGGPINHYQVGNPPGD